jgi:hypothetical protein
MFKLKGFFLVSDPLCFLHLGHPFFLIILFVPTTLLTGMTGISLHLPWPLTSLSHDSFLKENSFFVTDQTPQTESLSGIIPPKVTGVQWSSVRR